MITIRRGNERGRTRLDWLDSYHTFSFDTYYDPHWMQFRSLRVLNEDVVAPGRGFGMHPHRNMKSSHICWQEPWHTATVSATAR